MYSRAFSSHECCEAGWLRGRSNDASLSRADGLVEALFNSDEVLYAATSRGFL